MSVIQLQCHMLYSSCRHLFEEGAELQNVITKWYMLHHLLTCARGIFFPVQRPCYVTGERAASHWPAFRSPGSPQQENCWLHLHNLLISLYKQPSLRNFARHSHFLDEALLCALLVPLAAPTKCLCLTATLCFKAAVSWLEGQNHSVCPSPLSWYVCVCVVLPLGWVTSTPHTPISSLLLPTLLFICLCARHVPEPALISIPHNTVYLLRYQQKGREVRMKEGVGKREKESEKAAKTKREKEGWEQEEREKWFRESKT